MRIDDLIPLRKMDLELGKPLRWSVYDTHGVLLLARGNSVDSAHKLEVLFDKGLFRSPRREQMYDRARLETEPEKTALNKNYRYLHDRDKGKLVYPVAKLPIGIVFSLQTNAGDSGERYVCRYIGYQEEKSILVSNPLLDGRLVPCRDGQSFYVRCFNGKTALAFKAHIAKAHLVPFPYLHLAFPKDIEVMKVRESYRADVDIIALAQFGGVNAAARIGNLGFGGAQILAGSPIGKKGDNGRLSFRVNFEGNDVYIKTAISICSRTQLENDAGDPVYAYGVQFKGLIREHKAMIMNLVYQANVEL